MRKCTICNFHGVKTFIWPLLTAGLLQFNCSPFDTQLKRETNVREKELIYYDNIVGTVFNLIIPTDTEINFGLINITSRCQRARNILDWIDYHPRKTNNSCFTKTEMYIYTWSYIKSKLKSFYVLKGRKYVYPSRYQRAVHLQIP